MSAYSSPDATLRARLAAGLIVDHNLILIERDEIQRVIRELRILLTDLADPKNAPQVGKLLTVDAVLMGEVLDYGKIITPAAKLVVLLKLVSVETGRITFTLLVDARKVNTSFPFEVHREVIEEAAEKALSAIHKAGSPVPSR